MTIQHIPTARRIGPILNTLIEQMKVRQAHTPTGHLDNGMTIEALPTWYADTVFRSALEASWAATLDTLDIAWEYEPETITLPSGVVYIPDFWLPQIGTWLEVKGPGVPRVEKAHELAQVRACRCSGRCSCEWPGGELVIVGHPARGRDRAHRHHGHLDWSAPNHRVAYFSWCMSCFARGWSVPTGRLLCRSCREPWQNVRAHRPADGALTLINAVAFSL